MNIIHRFLTSMVVLLIGCNETLSDNNQPTHPAHNDIQSMALGDLSERLLGLPSQKIMPVIGSQWVVQAQQGSIDFYDKQTQKKIFEVDNCDAQMAPVFVTDTQLVVADKTQNLWLIDTELQQKNLIATLPAPLICAPLVVKGESLFLQYLNDVVELITLEGLSSWRTGVMATTSYYRQTAYAPCYDNGQIFFSYPGSSVIAINADNGQINWISAPIAQSAISTTAFHVPQVQSPLRVVGHMIVFSTLDHQLFCLDKDSGIVTKKWALWQRSPQLVHDDMIFFINDMGALTAFDAVTQKILWQHENFSGLVFESLLSLGEGKIVAQTAQQKLNFIDTQNGATIFEYEHAYPDLKIFASDEQQHIFALDQYRNFIDIPGTFIS